MRDVFFKRVSMSYMDILSGGTCERVGIKKRLIKKPKKNSNILPGLKNLGLNKELLLLKKNFIEAFFKNLMGTQAKVSKLNLEIQKNLVFKVYNGQSNVSLLETDLTCFTHRCTSLDAMYPFLYPFFNQISFSLNDFLKLINCSFKTNLQTPFTIHSPLDRPTVVINSFSKYLSVISRLLNGFFCIDHLDSQASHDPLFYQARQDFMVKTSNGFFQKNGLNHVYSQVRQDIEQLYHTDILNLRTRLILIQQPFIHSPSQDPHHA